MALTAIVFNEPSVMSASRGNIGTLTAIVTEESMQHKLPASPAQLFTGGGMAVKITDGIIYHLRDDQGNTINKPIVVV